jgi:hypothetical protein
MKVAQLKKQLPKPAIIIELDSIDCFNKEIIKFEFFFYMQMRQHLSQRNEDDESLEGDKDKDSIELGNLEALDKRESYKERKAVRAELIDKLNHILDMGDYFDSPERITSKLADIGFAVEEGFDAYDVAEMRTAIHEVIEKLENYSSGVPKIVSPEVAAISKQTVEEAGRQRIEKGRVKKEDERVEAERLNEAARMKQAQSDADRLETERRKKAKREKRDKVEDRIAKDRVERLEKKLESPLYKDSKEKLEAEHQRAKLNLEKRKATRGADFSA